MEKKTILLRIAIALVVIAVFAISMIPLAPRDFYETFLKMAAPEKRKEAETVVADAKKLQTNDPVNYPFASEALLKAAESKGTALKPLTQAPGTPAAPKLVDTTSEDNRDIVSAIRKKAASSIRLGLDLAGGVEFFIELIPDADVMSRENANYEIFRDQAIEILRKRLESQKIFESEIAPAGGNFVSLRAPITSKDEKVKLLNLIQMSAKLRFRLVNDELTAECNANPEHFKVQADYEVLSTTRLRPGKAPVVEYFVVENRYLMDGKGIVEAFPAKTELGQRYISLRFNSEGGEQFGRVTSENVGKRLAIVLDGKLYCAPVVRQAITGGSAQIDGQFSQEELSNIANALASGGLPFQIKVQAVFDTDPSLGSDNVTNGIYAGLAALALVVLFMIAYYRLSGVIAVTALGVNVVLVLGALAAFDATLTLPGIAGIILTIGMAVDANVLIFERIREELQAGKSLCSAVDAGYEKAFSAVFDANITTLFVALILYQFGTGAVKGFAVTLGIGILTSLFTALFLTRLIFDLLLNYTSIKTLKMSQFLREPKFDFLAWKKWTVGLSLVLIVTSFGAFFWRGSDLFGVDFTGGTQVSFNYEERIPVKSLEKTLSKLGIDGAVLYKSSSAASDNKKMEITIRKGLSGGLIHGKSPRDVIQSALVKEYPQAKCSGGLETTVGGLVGREFTRAAVIAVILSFAGIIVYVSLRYEFTYAMAAILALLHDIIGAGGIFAITGRQFSLSALAAMLTVIGYSVNDTIVIFDRIRENVSLHPEESYGDIVNLSINETLNRTLLTSITTLIVAVVLFFFGGIAINDFIFIMMLGIIVGTYSSVCISSAIVSVWHRKIGVKR